MDKLIQRVNCELEKANTIINELNNMTFSFKRNIALKYWNGQKDGIKRVITLIQIKEMKRDKD